MHHAADLLTLGPQSLPGADVSGPRQVEKVYQIVCFFVCTSKPVFFFHTFVTTAEVAFWSHHFETTKQI